MARIAVGLEYDGSKYAGWQSQRAVASIQATVEAAFARVAAAPVAVVCAGRTDAGVHACGQVIHFDTAVRRSLRGWQLGANTQLPLDVSVRWVRPVPEHFHARYSAEWRTYRYFILNRGARPALAAGRVCWVHRPLDAARMQRAANALVGEHDFSAFRSAECQANSPVRRLRRLEVMREGAWLCIEASANAFLHHMVRNLAGLLIAVGRGDRDPESAAEVLASGDRTRSAATAPAAGLYLWHVGYPEAFALPDNRLDGTASRSVMIAPLAGCA